MDPGGTAVAARSTGPHLVGHTRTGRVTADGEISRSTFLDAAVSASTADADGTCDPQEARWIDLARGGDEQAFAALVRRHQDRLYKVALRMTGDPDDARDVVQETLIQAWQHLPGFRGESQFGTWATRILINRCHNLHRARRPVSPLPEDDTAADMPRSPAAETLAVAGQRRDAVRHALLALPLDQRAPLVLTAFGGYTHAETGRILGISEGAAKVRAHRARRALAGVLQEWR